MTLTTSLAAVLKATQTGASDAAGVGAVTASTADILRITNSSGASATYQIGIVARTA